MRFLAFSDVHAHPFPYGSTLVEVPGMEGLYNSRLADTIKALQSVATHAVENNIKLVLFGGDLFHTRTSIKTEAFSLVVQTLKKHFFDNDITVVMIPGNHDYADRSGNVHSLQSINLMPGSVVMDEVDLYIPNSCENVGIISVPYTDNLELAKENLKEAAKRADMIGSAHKILLAHLGIQGGKVGTDFVLRSDRDIKTSDIPTESFDMCLFGHYHQHQQIGKNSWFIGALTEQNWSDVGGARGFLDIDLSGVRPVIKRYETEAPKFVIYKPGQDTSAIRKQDFVKIATDKAFTEMEQEQLRDSISAQHVEVVPIKKVNSDIKLEANELNPLSVLRPWIQSKDHPFNEDELYEVGRNLILETQNDI